MLEARPDLDEAARLVEIDGALPARQVGRANLGPRPAARPVGKMTSARTCGTAARGCPA